MQVCTPCVMESYFEMFGWNFKVFNGSTWKTGESDEASELDFVVHMTDLKIRFEVSPFLGCPVDWELWPEAMFKISEMQDCLQTIDLKISEAGDLTLSTEVLRQTFNYENFCNTAEILQLHATEIREKVFISMKHSGLDYFVEPAYYS